MSLVCLPLPMALAAVILVTIDELSTRLKGGAIKACIGIEHAVTVGLEQASYLKNEPLMSRTSTKYSVSGEPLLLGAFQVSWYMQLVSEV